MGKRPLSSYGTNETVIAVNDRDEELSQIDKAEAHRSPGILHRAVSLCLYDSNRMRLLLQKRSSSKYHFAGRWSNAACSHPRPDESGEAAVRRAARNELRVELENLRYSGQFCYRATDEQSGLVEWELDHVFLATAAGEVIPNPSEIDTIEWTRLDSEGMPRMVGRLVTPWFNSVIDTCRSYWM